MTKPTLIERPNCLRKTLSGFRWLKINDMDWLKESLPGIWNQSAKITIGL